MRMALEPGRQAPDFSLQAAVDGRIEERPATLRGYRGRALVLAFYPADWSPVCSDQLPIYNELLSEFRGFGAELAGLSVDGVWSHRAFGLFWSYVSPLDVNPGADGTLEALGQLQARNR
jgi:peroxiredoxin